MVSGSSLRALSEASLRSATSSAPSPPCRPNTAGLSGSAVISQLRSAFVQERLCQLNINLPREFSTISSTKYLRQLPTGKILDVEVIKREVRRGVEFDRRTKQPTWVLPGQLTSAAMKSVNKLKVRHTIEMTLEQRKHWEAVVAMYPDPFHLAKEVDRLLKRGQTDDAVGITRIASKTTNAVVAWGFLISYFLEHSTVQEGIKLFNEMKKRKQVPSVKTYTAIFHSLSQSQHTSRAIREAVRLYVGMLNDPVKPPNTIHLNAVLEVCARGYDLDSLYAVAATADSGMRRPDSATFTIMLNAMKSYLENSPEIVQLQQTDQIEHLRSHVMPMIQKAKALWERVVDDWITGRLTMTETLVCAFGRLLMLGPWGIQIQVLRLVEQTMGIPVMVKEILTIISSKTDENLAEILQKRNQSSLLTPVYAEPIPTRLASSLNDDGETPSTLINMDEYHSHARKLGITSADGIRFSRSDVAIEPEISVDALYELITRPNLSPFPTEATESEENKAYISTPSLLAPDNLSKQLKKKLDKARRKQLREDRRLLKSEIHTFGKAISPEAIAAKERLDKISAENYSKPVSDILEGKEDIDDGEPKILEADVLLEEESRLSTDEIPEQMRLPLNKTGGVRCEPGRNTLSMLLSVCTSQRQNTAGEQYWKLLTGKEYRIIPDENNWRSLLNLQKRSHNSKHIVLTLKNMPILRNHDVVVALTACLEDKHNLRSLANASIIMDTIDQEFPIMPPAAAGLYAELIERFYITHVCRITRKKVILKQVGNLLAESYDKARAILRKNQVDMMKRCVIPKGPNNLVDFSQGNVFEMASDITGGIERVEKDTPLGLKRGIVSSFNLATRLISSINHVLADGRLPDVNLLDLERVKKELNRYISEYEKVNLCTTNGWVEWQEYEKEMKSRSEKRIRRQETWLKYNRPKTLFS